MSYPGAKLTIIGLPDGPRVEAQKALLGLAAFETWGLFVGWKFLPLAHAAHLGGLVLGAGYVVFNGREEIWKRARLGSFQGLRAAGWV